MYVCMCVHIYIYIQLLPGVQNLQDRYIYAIDYFSDASPTISAPYLEILQMMCLNPKPFLGRAYIGTPLFEDADEDQ